MTPSKKGFALHKTAFVHCGCCEFHHPLQFTGDCRNDANRFSTGRLIPVRWIGEQHVREDLGRIPSFADWVRAIRPEPWMGRASLSNGSELLTGIGVEELTTL